MPVAVALFVGVVVLATVLIGLFWAMVILLPFYVYVAAAIFLIWRTNRRHADLSASVERGAKRQRLLNEQEMRAWRNSLEIESGAGPEKQVRRFDSTRDPPERNT